MQNTPKGKNILVIDDDKVILKILGKILEKEGYTVNTAETGREALSKIQTQQYDVALIDVKLQDMNGLDLLNRIQSVTPKIVKIMLTGYPSDEDRMIAFERGADDYLAKPVKSERLIAIIESKLKQDECQTQTGRYETPTTPAYKTPSHILQDDFDEVTKK